MVNLKTKFGKHVNDNEKRRRSIKEKEKVKSNQSQIIKEALSNSTLSNNSSKKILFDAEDDEDKQIITTNSKSNSVNDNGKSILFGSSDSETEDFEIKEKFQFSGKKGFELLNLQSTYGNDERFKIDERFLEDEKEEYIEENRKTDEMGGDEEKARQLKILEGILGTSLVSHDKEKKMKKRINEMVRYDASNKDHQIYEIKKQTETPKPTPSKKRKELKKTPHTDKQELNPKVSKEKYYEVSNEIKNRFKEKNEESGQFSLLQTYGVNGAEKSEDSEEEEEDMEFTEENNKNIEQEVEYRTQSEPVIDEPNVEQQKVTEAKGIWKESFFFDQNDHRFKEGLEFINKKNSEQAKEAAENYDQTRKKLKEILRLHLKKQMHKKDPFRNKIGGMSKKQLTKGLKNQRMISSRRKLPSKKNPGRRI